jgi:hypothetical protein
MFRGQGTGVLFGLFAGIAHQHVPAPLRAAATAREWLREAGQISLFGWKRDFLGAAGFAALLGLEHEAAAFVEIDTPVTGFARLVVEGDGALEHVVVAVVAGGGGLGLRQVEQRTQLGQEQRKVGAFGTALIGKPARDEPVEYVVFPHCSISKGGEAASATESFGKPVLSARFG